MVVGQRVNVDMPSDFLGLDEAALHKYESAGEIFQTNAEDYFIVSRHLFDWDGHDVPDFVVGGVAFDNWIVAKANRDRHALVIDATRTITAIHQNHDADVKVSHAHPKSHYNAELARKHGGFSGGGKVSDAEFSTERRRDGKVAVLDKHRLLY